MWCRRLRLLRGSITTILPLKGYTYTLRIPTDSEKGKGPQDPESRALSYLESQSESIQVIVGGLSIRLKIPLSK